MAWGFISDFHAHVLTALETFYITFIDGSLLNDQEEM
jgi:hypothetical protein